MNNEKIAIIGIGIIAPDASNKDEFWQNIKTGRNCISEVPKDRWDPRLYYDADKKAQDKTYSKIGGFIKDFKFDPIKYRIPPQSAKQISRLQKMTVEASRMAFEDSGYDKKDFDKTRTAVSLGNAMGAMGKEMTDFKVYKYHSEDILKKTKGFSSLSKAEQNTILSQYEEMLDEGIVSINEDTMPGELSNVTAGRVANIFNLNGPNMTFDAACASSLAALDYAVLGLRAGKFDMAVCGGADEMMSPPAYVKFCKIGALSEDGSWVFDEKANGFVMAESVAIYILKRYTDAVKDNDKIYALINAVGASSDGKGKGITAPNPNGQKLAIKNTFDQVDYSPADIQLIEAHGTATKAGDASELQVLQELYSDLEMPIDSVALGSVKSQIGHTKAAAGAVSMVKTALALHNKILPPSINFKNLNKVADFSNSPLRVITKAEEWKTDKVRRANVSAFGFGGANFHVALEEYLPGRTKAFTKETEAEAHTMPIPEVVEDALTPFAGLQGEAVTFSAPTGLALVNQMQSLKDSTISKWGEPHPMAPFAIPSNERVKEAYGVSIVSKSPKDLQTKIDLFAKSFKDDVFTNPPLTFKLKGMYPFRKTELKTKIGFLFPGQGSQYVDMMRDLAAKYKVVQDTFDEADVILKKMINIKLTDVLWSKPNESKDDLEKREAAIKQTQMTQPAVLTADVAMMRLLQSYGVNADMAAGHSLGEYAAATASGVFTFENGLKAVTSRAKEMSKVKVKDPGKMASIAWNFEKVEKELKKIKGYIICANKNCPVQTVIAGEADSVDEAVKMFGELGVQAQIIPVSHAFHSQIIEPAMGPYREFLEAIPISSSNIPLLSNVTADYFPKDKQGIYDLLIKQMVSPVEFIKQLERMYDDGVRTFIEVGPKRVLSAFTTATLKDKKDIRILSSNHPKRGGITEFNDLLANLISLGYELNWNEKTPKAGNTFYNPYYLNWSNKNSGQYSQSEGQSKSGITASHNITANTPQSVDALEMVKKFGFNFNNIAFSGIAGGTPGTWGKLFREHNLDEILAGKNMIEPIDEAWRKNQIDKDIIRVVKSPTGNHKIEAIDSTKDSIKLSARNGEFDIAKEFGLPPTIAKALTSPFAMALAAGVLALKDAGIPLIHYYKKTSTGSYLPEKWALPESIAKDTGVIFASAFPVVEALIDEVTNYFNKKYSGRNSGQMWDIYDSIISKLNDSSDKQNLRHWMEENFSASHNTGKPADSRGFSQNFLLKIIPIADSQFAQWVGAKGPSMHISAACASTTQAVHTAEVWIRTGKAKRVVIIAADDITNKTTQDWTMAGFIASGAATTTEKLSEAALPFDRRRHGLIVGSAAVGIVIEDETIVRKRGMTPLARLLLSESANSAFHATKLDTNHVSSIMEDFIKKIENIYDLNKKDFAHKTVFLSHETYTPARGGSAAAEVKALKKAFGEYADKVIVSNVKGFTGHSMGAALEDIVAVRSLNTGIIPPIANYKEPDPELAGITLSQGGQYNPEFALRFAAGFGSHMAMSFIQKTYSANQPRIEDSKSYTDWLKQISGDNNAELEVVFNTLRIKDAKMKPQKNVSGEVPGFKPTPIKAMPSAPKPTPRPVTQPVAAITPSVSSSATAVAERPSSGGLDEKIKEDILNMLTDKTGYPKDMLEIDLDMEADLGIDTVKQAELFASMREHFSLPKNDNLSLKDYPTIRHCVKFVMDGKGIGAENAEATGDRNQGTGTKEQQTTTTTATTSVSSDGLDEKIKEDILNMLTDKTGYPKDMLEIDLDMEADLGIDTVKQAELFASMREHFSLPKNDNLSLKDYPTIRHCVKFVMDGKGIGAENAEATGDRNQGTGTKEQQTTTTTATTSVSSDDLDEKIKEDILNMLTDKTGYPKDMLELDLDMEADLGIDTVKQAELFASMREHFSLPKNDNLSLKDYPTIRHCVKFVMDEKGIIASSDEVSGDKSQVTGNNEQQTTTTATQSKPQSQTVATSVSSDGLDEKVKEDILDMLAEKTGYPKDMLELDLDMEADLGIDTVKQAELFASMREHFSLPKNDNLSLKDYPTIRHCIKFVMEGKGINASDEVASDKSQVTSETATKTTQTAVTKPEPEAEQANRHIRYVPKVVLSKADKGNIRKLSPEKPVIIFSDNAELTRLFKNELSKMKVVSHVFTSLKTKAANTIVNDWNDSEAVEKNLQDFAAKHNNVQGIVYLLGTVDKKLGKKTAAFEDLKHYAMPLFLAIKYFNKTLNTPEDGNSTFMAIITTVDGHMGYRTKKTYDPIYGAINGIALCARKELENCTVKLIDFAPSSSSELIAQKTFFEIIYSDSRLALSYDNNKRYTLMMTPESIETETEKLDLRGKKVLITGGGRGLGALFGKIIAEKYQPHIIIFDIINFAEESAAWAKMDENQLKELKSKLWEDLKASGEKATPVILERAFTKIKDSARLYKTIEELKATGSKVTYYCCDLNNPTIFNSTIESIRKEFGKLDGVIHFAGLERSKLIADKTIDEFYAVFNTKANSAMNLLHSEIVKERGFWVMISSIAGKFGNLGQSDYAAASDYISKLAISLQNKGARAFAVDMTAYANIGMAIRPGVEAFLKSQKVDFIYPNEGMLTIADELVYGTEPEIVLSASLGKMDWDTQLELADGMEFSEGSKNESHFHFIKDAKKNGDKAQGAKEFNIADDPYLLDHAINGTPLVPGVMGIETFAQTAAFTLGKNPKSLKNIRFQLPIKLLKNKPVRIKITAEKEDEDLISMKMESDFINSKGLKLGKTRTHFMGKASENFKSKLLYVDKTSIPTKKKYKISKEDIYKIYFHGPSFQVLDGIISLEKNKVLGVFKTPKMPLWQNKDENLIAHPMAMEAAFQTCGFRDIHFDSKMALPDAVDEIIIHDNDRTTDTLYIHAIHKGINADGKSSYDAFVFDEKGKIRIEIKNYVGIPTKI